MKNKNLYSINKSDFELSKYGYHILEVKPRFPLPLYSRWYYNSNTMTMGYFTILFGQIISIRNVWYKITLPEAENDFRGCGIKIQNNKNPS